MSIDDEIRQKKQSLQAAVDAAARKQADAERLRDAMSAAGMGPGTPILLMPSADLQAIISETMSRMIFSSPKIIRSLPDGTTRVRKTRNNQNKSERADDYSFDVNVKVETVDKSTHTTSIWFFKNGSVAFCKDDLNIDNPGVTAAEVRDRIIETIANTQVVRPSNNTSEASKQTNNSSGGCYIATAVYGSYDCPEVWTLRRYRDYILQPTWYGKLFIKMYYAISPSLVRRFGKQVWFHPIWRKKLDFIIDNLQRKGFSNKPYDD